MTRVLITGATGFLGLPCVRRAVAAGFEVHAVARTDRGELPVGVRFHAVDVLDGDRVGELMAAVQPTHLLHLAWIATPGVFWTSPDNPRWRDASQELLKAFGAFSGKRAVMA